MNNTPDPGSKGPLVCAQTPVAGGVRVILDVPPHLAWFAGHFPAEPILPGAVQTGWAVALAQEHFGFDAEPTALDRIKFLRPVRPGSRLELELGREQGRPNRVSWRFSENGNPVSSGTMDFAPA